MGDNPEVIKYLKSKNLNYKHEGSQYKVQNCVYCGDKSYHFYINKITGQFRCVKCGESGNMYVLKKKMGDILPVTKVFESSNISRGKRAKYYKRCLKYHKSLIKNYVVRRYLYGKWG